LYRVGDEAIVVAQALAGAAFGDRAAEAELLATATGAQLDGLAVRHPLLPRDSIVVLAEYVDLETGTGAVHTAPGHGADDFDTGVKYDLPVLNPVSAAGIFTSEAGPYAGMHIWKANPKIVEDLRASGALWRAYDYEHSYPHCWRCHNAVIFRATAQWFIAMDQNRLRSRAIDAVANVAYSPSWGRARQAQMLEHHPEWCISRQRTWGTPIPALICTGCNETILDARVARIAAKRFGEMSANAWWSDAVEVYLPAGFACPNCGGTTFEKGRDIVDIWFESGVTHLAVLGHDGLPWPSDLVLEGGDQYRGWFRSSLLTAVAIKGGAPYKHVVKNGWVNDEQGRAMSKSRGTGIDARDAMDRWGADVLRLWAASVEFVDDVRFGPTVVEHVSRVYRNIRNRIRFMLSNLDDLPADGVVARAKLEPLDQLACNVVDAFVAEVKGAYDRFEIHDAYLRIVEFESAMSSLYFDALKDPLYSRAQTDRRRRSAQSALLYVLKRFLTVVAPVLSFTAEEAWQSIPAALRGDETSVFDTLFRAEQVKLDALRDDLALWEVLRDLRARVAANDTARDFEAQAVVRVLPVESQGNNVARPGGIGRLHARLLALGDNLREVLVVSQVHLMNEVADDQPARALIETIRPADGAKCRRCWKFRPLGTDPDHPSICADCATVVRALDFPA